jgi:hypothetical protein
MRVLVVTVGDIPNDLPFVAPRLPNASFMLPARGKERFASVWCNDDTDYEDRGYDSPRQMTLHRADDHMGKDPKGNDVMVPGVASQLINSPGQGGPSWAERGVFIAAGEKPTEDELKKAEHERDAYRRRIIDSARFRYQKDRHTRNITDEAFWAAERMGLEEEWMPLAANPCPNCGRAVKSTAATCVHCGLILDEKKFAEFKFASVPTAPPPSTGLRVAGPAR